MEELYKLKYIKQNELNDIENQIKELKYNIQNSCAHTHLIKFREFDGHTWKNNYSCENCNKIIYNINDSHIINTHY